MSLKTKKPGGKVKKAKVKVFQKKTKPSEKQVINELEQKYSEIDLDKIKAFNDFPLSTKTQNGLKECSYVTPTDIQLQTIHLALQGKDILGAAKTGSGKTLAFIVPILEILYRKQWSHLDGVGALVITPTRELAYQIYETLRKVGVKHDFSAALIIGGKDLKFERKRLEQVNIIICTPGRLLQHMDENPLFSCDNLQVLVLDEADRCLDMGFEQTMNAIIENLPLVRQTLLFSATQTTSVKDLARLSLKDLSYVWVHENSKFSTPDNLEQTYTVCELKDKVAVLWSFIRNHKNCKTIIFLSSCKQVKYIYEAFCRLRPGVSLLALYGTLHQLKRMAIYESFVGKQHAVLFATDIAARGLDFPAVDWVVQADCPEDAETYIHRVGRTARFNRGGKSSLLLLPSEKEMLKELEKKKIPIEETEINVDKLQNPVRKMESFLARDPNLKDTAQRAFVAYAKAVALMKDKSIFNVKALDTDSYAYSLGLAIPPRIRFLQRQEKRENAKNHVKFEPDSDAETNVDTPKIEASKKHIKFESDSDANTVVKNEPKSDDSDASDDDLFKVKRADHDIELPTEEDLSLNLGRKPKKALTKAAMVKKLMKKKIVPNKKVVFDDEGEAVPQGHKEKRSQAAQSYENADEGGIDIEEAKKVLREEDVFDKQRFRERVKAQHKEAKRKLKEKKLKEAAERDDFGSESEDEAPDLSWLPDPDKIYGKENDGEGDKDESDDEGDGSCQEEEEKVTKKDVKKR